MANLLIFLALNLHLHLGCDFKRIELNPFYLRTNRLFFPDSFENSRIRDMKYAYFPSETETKLTSKFPINKLSSYQYAYAESLWRAIITKVFEINGVSNLQVATIIVNSQKFYDDIIADKKLLKILYGDETVTKKYYFLRTDQQKIIFLHESKASEGNYKPDRISVMIMIRNFENSDDVINEKITFTAHQLFSFDMCSQSTFKRLEPFHDFSAENLNEHPLDVILKVAYYSTFETMKESFLEKLAHDSSLQDYDRATALANSLKFFEEIVLEEDLRTNITGDLIHVPRIDEKKFIVVKESYYTIVFNNTFYGFVDS